jgi:hypothetical protein
VGGAVAQLRHRWATSAAGWLRTPSATSAIQEAQLAEYKGLGYLGDEFVGQIGLEEAYEQQLKVGPPAARST